MYPKPWHLKHLLVSLGFVDVGGGVLGAVGGGGFGFGGLKDFGVV